MAGKRLSPLRLTLIFLAALAAWITAGALSVASAQPRAPRVGVLPSVAWLVVALAAAAGTAWATRRRWPALLAIAGLLLLPWLPVPVPAAFYIWVGPLRTWVWVLIAAGVAAPLVCARAPASLAAAARDPRRAPRIAAVVASVLYLAGAYQVFPQLPLGDEPHYLVIAESLVADRDLKVENNYLQADYRAYFPGALRPDYLRRGQNGQIYSIHAPGLPALVAPVFALFSYPGVLALLAILSACGTALAWTAAWRVTRDAGAAWFGWAAVALSAPFFFQSFVAYPDALGATIVMLGALALTSSDDLSLRRLAWTGAALALLPWLHLRLAIAAAGLGVLIAIRQRQAPAWPRRAGALLAAPAISAVCWFAFFYLIYGTVDPRAPYGGSNQSALANAPRGLTGLAFDQQFGLLPNAPVYLCAALGFLPLLRRHARLAIEWLAVIVPYTLAVAAFEMWWAGTSSPARFLTPVLLTLAVPAAAWFHASRGQTARVLGLGALAVSLLITSTLAVVDRGALLYNARDGSSRLLLWISPLVDLTTGMPSLFQNATVTTAGHAAAWLAAVAATTLVGAAIARRGASTGSLAACTGAAAATAGMLATSIVWHSNGAMPLTPTTGTIALMHAYDAGSRQIAVQYAPLKRIPLADLPSRLTLATFPSTSPGVMPATGDPLIVVPHPAAATYAVEVALGQPGAGRVTVTVDRRFGPAWSWDLTGARGFFRREFRVPVPAVSMLVDGDAAARTAIDRLTLRAVSIFAARDREADIEPWHVARYGSAVVFLMAGQAYMEPTGTWVAGEGVGDFVIAPDDPATPLRLFIRSPPVRNQVTLDAGEWHRTLALDPGEERLFEIPMPRGRVAIPLRVTAAHGARPSHFEPGSTDTRFLGCWIETR
jgi:hypothetical protein